LNDSRFEIQFATGFEQLKHSRGVDGEIQIRRVLGVAAMFVRRKIDD
jgi:hypothetical protein